MKILIIGSAGVGKTHLFHLLSNTPPPGVRQSTPVMKRPVQVIQTTLKSSSSLKSVTDQELYELLASTVNKAAGQYGVVGSPTPHHVHVAIPELGAQEMSNSQSYVEASSYGRKHTWCENSSLLPDVEEPQRKHAKYDEPSPSVLLNGAQVLAETETESLNVLDSLTHVNSLLSIDPADQEGSCNHSSAKPLSHGNKLSYSEDFSLLPRI